MTNNDKPLFSYEYAQQEQKYDLRVARLFGFSIGFIAAILLITSLFYVNGKI
jgi:uncharacterized membrane protein YciS (DUF1049 family)